MAASQALELTSRLVLIVLLLFRETDPELPLYSNLNLMGGRKYAF